MSSLFRSCCLLLLLGALSCRAQDTVRICADPDNLPFSSQTVRGFDNRIAELLVKKIGKRPVFVWARARRGFIRERFNRGDCDLLMGTPQGLTRVRQTIPYYRSSYMFVTRRQDHLQLTHFSDPAIGSRRIGLQILEDDFSPPSLPLIRYGHAAQLAGFESFGTNAGDIIRAVATQKIGLAVVWGPVAGYYASRMGASLQMTAVEPPVDAGVPFQYSMTMGVHARDAALAEALNRAIEQERGSVGKILDAYHVPRIVNTGGEL